MFRCAVLAGVAALAACAILPSGPGSTPAARRIRIAVELPLAGDAGADGLRALDAITEEGKRLSSSPKAPLINLLVRDTARGGYANPHQDEGVDASILPPRASSIIRDVARDHDVLIAIGGLTSEIASTDFSAASATGVPVVTLAPAPDDCAAVLGQREAATPQAVSVSGAASLESVAVAQIVRARGYHDLGIIGEREVRGRATQALCFVEAIARQRGLGAQRILRANLTSDFATLKARAGRGEIDGFVYFGPSERGTLVCAAAGVLLLSAASIAAMTHHGYDSSTVPRACVWVRRVFDEKPAGRAAIDAAHDALSIAIKLRGGDPSKVTRNDIAAALSGATTPTKLGSAPEMAACAEGSADRAQFALVPMRAGQPSSFVVYDRRCTRG